MKSFRWQLLFDEGEPLAPEINRYTSTRDSSTTVRIYIDESGNTGAKVFGEQPVYACAAVWLSDDNEVKIEDELQSLRENHNIVDQMLGHPTGELKGGSLSGTRSGRSFLLELSNRCFEHNIPVSLLVLHKSFMGASVLVEDGLDPFHNPKVSQRWYNDARAKEEAARLIYDEVSEEALQEWWSARKDALRDQFEVANDAVVSELKASKAEKSQHLGEKLEYLDVEEFLETRREADAQAIPDFSPNFTSFIRLLHLVSEYSEEVEGSCTVVHDEQSQFEEEYKEYTEIMSEAPNTELKLTNGNTVRIGIPGIDTVRFEDSVGSTPIQIADCFAAVARTVIENHLLGEEIRDELSEILTLCSKTCIRRFERPSIFVVGPKNWQPQAFRSLMGYPSQ